MLATLGDPNRLRLPSVKVLIGPADQCWQERQWQ